MTEKLNKNNEFDAGKKIGIQFSKKLVISQHPEPLNRYNVETERYEPVVNDEGDEVTVTRTRIKIPASSQYRGFIFETTDNLFEPHKFDKEGADLGANSNMWMVKVFENASYPIKRTPYLEADKDGKRKLDFANQEIKKLRGKELRNEMYSWMKEKDSEIDKLKSLKNEDSQPVPAPAREQEIQ